MKKKDNLKATSLKQFLIPYIVLIILYSAVLIGVVNNQVKTHIQQYEVTAEGIAESYARTIAKSEEAKELLSKMLDNRLAVAGESIALYKGEYDQEALEQLAQRYKVDEVYIYNNQGEIIHTNRKYLGWKAYEGHPVYDFMNSNQISQVEDIRADSVSGIFYKYAYYKLPNGSFVQIGVLADEVEAYLGQFNTQALLESIKEDELVRQVSFIDTHYKIVNSTSKGLIGGEIQDEEDIRNIAHNVPSLAKKVMEGEEVYTIYVPVVYNNTKIGTLSIGQSTNLINSSIQNYIRGGIVNFFFVSILFGLVTFMIYRQNKQNYRIYYYDQLTGLPNYNSMQEYLDRKLKDISITNKAIFVLNCINYRTLNQIYGYEFGNMILKEITDKVSNLVRVEKALYRFESHKFIIYKEAYKEKYELEEFATQLRKIFESPFTVLGRHLYIDAVIGIVEMKPDDKNISSLLKKATIAVSNVKKVTSSVYSFYDDEMENKLQRKARIERELREAIGEENSELISLEYQPLLDLKTNRIVSFEALARMHSKQLGPVSPAEFIQIAEEKLLIAPLGYLVLKKAASFIHDLETAGFENIKVAVNVSGLQLLRDNFIETIIDLITSKGIGRSRLEIEITESEFLDNFELVNEKLSILRDKSIGVSLDDFGTGYSSLARIRELNIDTIKIDKSFIKRITHTQHNEFLTGDIISMAHKLGMKVVAEGVENEIQKQYLVDNKCDMMQGYLFSKPLSHDHAIELLKRTNNV